MADKTIIYIQNTGEPPIPVTARIEWLPDGKIKPLAYWTPDGSRYDIEPEYEMTPLAFLEDRAEGLRYKVKAAVIETPEPYSDRRFTQHETYLYLADNWFCGKNFIDGRYDHEGKEYIPVTLDIFPNRVMKEARQLAEVIRIEVMYSLGLSAGVGVSFNYIFSKLGSDAAKPNNTAVITKDNYKDIVWPRPAEELLFVGAARKKLLQAIGILTIGDIARADPRRLGKLLGKAGYDLWCFANGDDRNFKPANDNIGSIGNTITPPADLRNNEEASAVIYLLVSAISARLNRHQLKTRCISISLRDSQFNKIVRQCVISIPTDNTNKIFNKAYALFARHYTWANPLRSIGVRVDNLCNDDQLSLFELDECDLEIDMDYRIKLLTERFGVLEFEKTAATREW